MVAEVHCVGNHSLSLSYARKIPLHDKLADFARNHDRIASFAGQADKIFRPLYVDWGLNFIKHFLSHPTLKHYDFTIFWASLFRKWALKSAREHNELDERLVVFCTYARLRKS